MKLRDESWQHAAPLRHLVEILGGREGLTRYVGGAVRDTMLGLPVSDLDLATSLTPDDVVGRLDKAGIRAVPTGLAHGTITAVLPGGPVEVTTLRRDVATDGRHAQVAFTDDWREDAARRDFTINALSADPIGRDVYDYFDGLADLAAGIVRFIGDPAQRIAEDHLRILRFFRFYARFGTTAPDPAGLSACASRANDLMTLSRERIAQELLKLLAVEDPTPALRLMIAHGIMMPVLPEIVAAGVERLARLVMRERALDDPDPLRRLAALLPPDPAVVDHVAARLKLSTAQRKRLASAAEPGDIAQPRALAYAIGLESARDRLLLHASDAQLETGLAALRGWTPARLPVSGGDLIRLGLTAGRVVAATLQAVERRWVAEGFPDAQRADAIAREEVDQALRARK